MKEGIDETRRHFEKSRKFPFEQVVVVLVLARREIIVLLDLHVVNTLHRKVQAHVTRLEEVLLIAQRFLLLLPQLVQTIIVPVVIDELVVPLDTCLADPLANIVQLLTRPNDPCIDELQFRRQGFCDTGYSAQSR